MGVFPRGGGLLKLLSKKLCLLFLGLVTWSTFAHAQVQNACELSAAGYSFRVVAGQQNEISLRTLLKNPQTNAQLSWGLIQPAPSWVSIDTLQQTLKLSPGQQDLQGAKFSLGVSCGGDAGQLAEITVSVYIQPRWKHQGVLQLPPIYENEDGSIELLDNVVSPVGMDELQFSAVGLKENAPWLSLTNKGKLSGRPLAHNVGPFGNIQITVKHPSGGFATTLVQGEVIKAVARPKWTQVPLVAANATEDVPYLFDTKHLVLHSEKDPLTFSLLNAPDWLEINPFSGQLGGTPRRLHAGPLPKDTQIRVYFQRPDGRVYEDVAQLQLNVLKVNKPPKWIAPTIDLLPGATGADYSQSLAGSASDPDNDKITFSLKPGTGPAWGNVKPNGEFYGKPGLDNAGQNVWTAIASDGKLEIEAQVRVFVERTNQPPIVKLPINLPSAKEDQEYSQSLAPFVTEVDAGDKLTFSLAPNGSPWAKINADGLITGKPNANHLGAQKIVFNVGDGRPGHTLTVQANITVDHVNHAPAWKTPSMKVTLKVGQSLNVNLKNQIYDPDANDRWTFSMADEPSWVTLEADTGLMGGVAADPGVYPITVTVTDNAGEIDRGTLVVTVTGVNRKPYWDNAPNVHINDAPAGKPYIFDLRFEARDPDGDKLEFTVDPNGKPNWLTVTPAGLVTGTPPLDQIGKVVVLTITAADKEPLTATAIVDFTIVESGSSNQAPYWRDPNLKLGQVRPGDAFDFDLVPWAIDKEKEQLTFTLLPGSAAWLSIDNRGHLIGTVPTFQGEFLANLEVKDPAGGTDITNAKGMISSAGTLTKPVWQRNITFTATLGQDFSGTLRGKATDNGTNAITFAGVGDNKWLSIKQDGTIEGKPPTPGLHTFNARAFNAAGASDGTFDINVIGGPTNQPPVWKLPVKLSAPLGSSVAISLLPSVDDPENQPLTFLKVKADGSQGSTDAPWVTVTGTGMVQGIPPAAGVYNFFVKATDSGNLSAVAAVEFTVTEGGQNRAPVWKANGGVDPSDFRSISPNALFEVDLNSLVSDPDGDKLLISAPTLPPFLGIRPDGKLRGTPSASQVGIYNFSLRASDGQLVTTIKTRIEVKAGGQNGAPQWRKPLLYSLTANQPSQIQLNDNHVVLEPQGQAMIFALQGNVPPFVRLEGSVLKIDAKSEHAGQSYILTVRATDTDLNFAIGEITLNVTGGATNQRPPIWLIDPLKITVAGNVSLNVAKTAKDLNSPPQTMVFRKSSEHPWLVLSSDGQLTGTPPAPGRYDFQVFAKNSAGETQGSVQLTVNANVVRKNDRLNRTVLKAPTETIWVIDNSWSNVYGSKLTNAFFKALPKYSQTLDNSELEHTSVFLSSDAQTWTLPVSDGQKRYILGPSSRWLSEFKARTDQTKTGQALSSPFWSLLTFHKSLTQMTNVYGKGFGEDHAPVEVVVVTPQVDQFRRYAAERKEAWSAEKFVETFAALHAAQEKPFRFNAIAAHCPRLGDPYSDKATASAETDYFRATRKTGGSYIKWTCEAELGPAMLAYAKDVVWRANAQAKQEILLDSTPQDPGAITLIVGGFVIPGNTGSDEDRWAYDANRNSVRLYWWKMDLGRLIGDENISVFY